MIYMKEDWAAMKAGGSIVYDGTDGSITSITNPTGVNAWQFDVPPGALIPASNPIVSEGNYTKNEHSLNFPIIITNQAAKNAAGAMARSKVVIVYMKDTGEGEVLGNEQGLTVTAGAYEPNNNDTGGMIPLELKSVRNETRMPLSYFNTDEATTLAEYKALVTPGV